jgi:hypothetical protein
MHVDLANILAAGEVACHPFIVGELAFGNIRNRTEMLSFQESFLW